MLMLYSADELLCPPLKRILIIYPVWLKSNHSTDQIGINVVAWELSLHGNRLYTKG